MYELFCLNMDIYALCEMVKLWKFPRINLIRPNEKIPVFRITWSYLNLLAKPRIFQDFLKNSFMHFEREFSPLAH